MSLGQRAAAVFAALLAIPAAVELASRFVVHKDVLVYQDSLNPLLRFELRPAAEGMKEGVPVRISAQGLRERDVPIPKPADEYRVVVIGDEAAFALGVPEEAGFVRRLEGLLKPPPGRRLRTINASMYHYHRGEEVEMLKAKALDYQPDLVVFEAAADQGPTLADVRYPYPRLKNFLRAHSVFMRWVMERSFWSRPSPHPPPDPFAVRKDLAALGDVLRKAKVPGIVVLFPDPEQTREFGARVGAAYRAGADAAGLAFHDGSADFPQPVARFRLHKGLPWPNADGEKAAARGMAPAIQRLIPSTKRLHDGAVPSA